MGEHLMVMRIGSWNVNGLRSCLGKGFAAWLEDARIDVACLQEIKTSAEVLEGITVAGYVAYWHPAEKPGYSGTAILVREGLEVVQATYGIGVPGIDREGRVLCVEMRDFRLVNMYAPHSQRELARLGYKLDFCKLVTGYLQGLQADGKPLLFTGDLNVAHTALDLANPKANLKNAGFLPEERAWMDELVAAGFTDVFRHHCAEPGHYTWWSQRVGVREKNIGWRIDYFMADRAMLKKVNGCVHQPLQLGSDHCPVVVEIGI